MLNRLPNRLPRTIAGALLFSLAACLPGQTAKDDAAIQKKVDALLRQMTLEEKVEQMEQAAGQPMYTPKEKADALAKNGIGSFLFFTDPERINTLQRIAMTESRLHIPILFGYDVIHGFRTIMPVPLAMASSWDPALVERTQSMAAREARAAGVHWAFAPMVDIARDARWGRIMEGAGEDPYLGEQMAAAQVRGFQGKYAGAPDHILVSVKHFAGYGAAEGGRDYDSTNISDEQLQNVYLRPYKAGVEAGAATVMSAYQNLNGVPATGNRWLLTDVLRHEWGFKGFVVSDWESVGSMKTHGFAKDEEDAAIRGVQAGVNMEMTGSTYRKWIPAAVKSGKVPESEIDALVRPILAIKYKMGLFENPYADLKNFQQVTLSTEERKASRTAAEQTAVLLKNDNHLLPLSGNLKSLAVIGPLADSKLDTMGSWAIHGDRRDTVTVVEALRESLPQTKISEAVGVEIERGSATIFDEQVIPEKPTFTTDAAKSEAFAHAIELARNAEATVLVLGEAQTMSGEAASRARLNLPGEQQKLLEAVVALGKPVVLVLMTGRPLDITWAQQHVPAILNIWYPGTEGGHAAANLLLGKVNPSGHLPVTWPRESGQEPLYYYQSIPQNPDNTEHRYWDASSAPLYPFGYGLSYADIRMKGMTLDAETINADGTLCARVTVENTSKVAGAQVVQVYTHQRAGSAARPVRELKAFQKVWLAPGETRTVALEIPVKELSYWSPVSKKVVLEPGDFDLWAGFDATATEHKSFHVTAGR